MCSTAVAFRAPNETQLNQKGLTGSSFFLIFVILSIHFKSNGFLFMQSRGGATCICIIVALFVCFCYNIKNNSHLSRKSTKKKDAIGKGTNRIRKRDYKGAKSMRGVFAGLDLRNMWTIFSKKYKKIKRF